MIHQYKNNGYNIVLDVNSGSVHVVDDLVYDAIALLDGGKTEEETGVLLKDKYPAEEIKEALEECRELGINDSMIHEDFMIGCDSMNIDAVCADGSIKAIFRKGNWAF